MIKTFGKPEIMDTEKWFLHRPNTNKKSAVYVEIVLSNKTIINGTDKLDSDYIRDGYNMVALYQNILKF